MPCMWSGVTLRSWAVEVLSYGTFEGHSESWSRSTTSASRFHRGACSVLSAATGRARRPRCGSSAGCRQRTRATSSGMGGRLLREAASWITIYTYRPPTLGAPAEVGSVGIGELFSAVAIRERGHRSSARVVAHFARSSRPSGDSVGHDSTDGIGREVRRRDERVPVGNEDSIGRDRDPAGNAVVETMSGSRRARLPEQAAGSASKGSDRAEGVGHEHRVPGLGDGARGSSREGPRPSRAPGGRIERITLERLVGSASSFFGAEGLQVAQLDPSARRPSSSGRRGDCQGIAGDARWACR